MSDKKFDLVVIGSGPGGYVAAIVAAQKGMSVACIEKRKTLGGTCLNVGCIPSKALLHITKVMDEAASLSKMGVTYGSPKIDIDAVRDHKNRIVKQLNTGIAQMAKARKVQTLHGLASFISNDEIKVLNEDEEVRVSFDKCIIASGSSSAK